LRFRSKVIALDEPPRRGDVVVDLNGGLVLPGLINAHDHLELNHYGLLKGRERYDNASDWIADMRARLRTDPSILANRHHPLASRLFIGGLKNLLAGVTTVAHHNPLYREIRRNVPIRVVRRFGWAHSFLLENQPVGARGEPGGEVRARYRATPGDAPFIVHVGEGIDEAAARELDQLDASGCLGSNTVLVHGVALDGSQWRRVADRGGSLVWCPSSNQFLFGRTTPVRQLLDVTSPAHVEVCLGSDSRVTGSRDLLGEISEAASMAALTPRELLRMVTTAAARVLRLPDAGAIEPGARADLIVIPARSDDAAEALLGTTRREVSFVAVGGRPLLAAPSIAKVFRPRATHAHTISVDGIQRLADPVLAEAIRSCPIREPGVECV
jgi:cytosine/adenosine deaminase-related metal-dependent hydrolase